MSMYFESDGEARSCSHSRSAAPEAGALNFFAPHAATSCHVPKSETSTTGIEGNHGGALRSTAEAETCCRSQTYSISPARTVIFGRPSALSVPSGPSEANEKRRDDGA